MQAVLPVELARMYSIMRLSADWRGRAHIIHKSYGLIDCMLSQLHRGYHEAIDKLVSQVSECRVE